MKKLFLLTALLAAALFTSCQKEEIDPNAGSGIVNFTVQVPSQPLTRADSPYSSYKLIYSVYLANGAENEGSAYDNITSDNKVYQGVKSFTSEGASNVTLELLNDQSYVILFWAQNDNAWGDNETIDLLNITYPEGVQSNNAKLEAFNKRIYIEDINTNFNKNIVLTRPFAQINIGSLMPTLQLADKLDLNKIQSKITVSGLGNGFNVAKNSSKETIEEQVFAYNVIPKGKILNDYTHLAMNYVFAPETTVDLTYHIKLGDPYNDISNTIVEVPVRQNYKTNIVGNLLTSTADYTISINDEWGTPDEVVELWDGTSTQEPEVKTDETTNEPYYSIDEPSELAWFAEMINGGLLTKSANTQEVNNFKLTGNIDLDNQPWTPIGYNPNEVAGNEKYFTGVFDGNGYEIRNLYIDVKDKGGVGLFGAVYNATIKNLTLRNVNIKAVESESDPANTSGAEGKKDYIVGGHIGAVVGYDAKTGNVNFENVHVTGLIKIEGETRAAQGQRVGGIIGGRGSSTYSFKNVSVNGDEGSYIKGYCSTAGIIGQNQGAATFEVVHTNIDVYAVTFGAGGIAGIARHGSTFTNCSSAGNITLDASKTQLSSYSANYPYRVGGIAGCWSDSKTGVLTLIGCSYSGDLTSIDKDGNAVTSFDYAGYVGRGYGLKDCAGSTVDVNGTKYVQAFDDVYGIYTVEGVYEINTLSALKSFASKVNAGDTFEGKTVKLTADIDLKNEHWTPIGYWQTFNGTFDGNGKTISNLKHHGTEEDCYVGLFGYAENATFKNLTINNVDIKLVANDSWAGGHIGSLVGNIEGNVNVENITVKGNVKIDGDITKAGAGRIGGVIGGNAVNVTIKNVTVNANEGSFVRGNSSIGGIAGQLQGEILFEECTSNINVSAQQFYAGGIIGLAAKHTTFNTCSTSGSVSVLAGRSGNKNDLYRVGGIAGGWDDDVNVKLVLTNCETNCTLSGKDADGKEATSFDCNGFVGRGYSAVVGAKVSIDGVEYEYVGDGKYTVDGYSIVADGLFYKENTYLVKNANGLVALSTKGLKAGEKVLLGANIDLTGIEFNGLNAFNSENNNYFDGQNFTVSNWTNNSGSSDMGFIKNWVGTIKNINFENCNLKTNGRSAIVAAKVYGNIENCHVVNCTIEDSYWACGLIAGLYNAGNISECSATNSSVKSNGGTGAIVGVINETAGTRSITDCSVSGCTVNNTGIYGEDYSGALVCGMINITNSTVKFANCTLTNNTKNGKYVGDLYYSAEDDITIVVE